VLECWEIVQTRKPRLHEGLLLQVLHTAARHGLTDLAWNAVEALQGLGSSFSYAVYHLEPLVEAGCQSGDLAHVNRAVQLMRSHNLLVPHALPLFRNQDEDTNLDQQWTTLQSLNEKGEQVDIVLLNSLCLAAMRRAEPQRALGYLRMASDLNLVPTEDTYRLLIRHARTNYDSALAKSLQSMANDQGIEVENPEIRSFDAEDHQEEEAVSSPAKALAKHPRERGLELLQAWVHK